MSAGAMGPIFQTCNGCMYAWAQATGETCESPKFLWGEPVMGVEVLPVVRRFHYVAGPNGEALVGEDYPAFRPEWGETPAIWALADHGLVRVAV